MTWAWDNRTPLEHMLAEHLYLVFVPLFLGLVLSVPLGLFLARAPISRGSALSVFAIVESIPVLSWFVFLPALLGTTLDASVNVVVGLTVLVTGMLTRSIAASVSAIPQSVRATADAIGFTPTGRALHVDLPVALPGVFAGLRAAAVACVTLATLAALIGAGGLGRTLTEGFSSGSEAEVLSGTAVIVVLAFGIETLLHRAQRLLSPWSQLAPVR